MSTEAGAAYINFEVAELLRFWAEKIVEIDASEREKRSLGLLLEKGLEVICVPPYKKRMELQLAGASIVLFTNLGQFGND